MAIGKVVAGTEAEFHASSVVVLTTITVPVYPGILREVVPVIQGTTVQQGPVPPRAAGVHATVAVLAVALV